MPQAARSALRGASTVTPASLGRQRADPAYRRPVRSRDYSADVIAESRRPKPPPPVVPADPGLVVEEVGTGWCGAVVACDKERVSLEDRRGKVRVFPLERGGFLLEGAVVTLARPVGRSRPGDGR